MTQKMKTLHFVMAVLIMNGSLLAQDSISYLTPVENGVYLTYNDFRHNASIKTAQIVSRYNKTQLDFLGKVTLRDTFSYRTSAGITHVPSATLFGFMRNNTFYVNYKGEFYRVPVFGAISYFVAEVVVSNANFDPRFGYPGGTSTSTEVREFVMDFYDGQIEELSLGKAEALLSRDADLYQRFKKLKRSRQKDELYRFIREYNALHPVYYLLK
jgi:hypothetical protein